VAKVESVPCPQCSGNVSVNVSGGGRGTNDLTHYSADCDQCGMLVDHLSGTGRHDSAVRDYNRWARSYTAPTVSHSVTVRAGHGGYDGGAAHAATVGNDSVALSPLMNRETRMPVVVANIQKSEFARGYFCAVAVALREDGDTTIVRSLFRQGGDAKLADPLDIELFCEYGLMA